MIILLLTLSINFLKKLARFVVIKSSTRGNNQIFRTFILFFSGNSSTERVGDRHGGIILCPPEKKEEAICRRAPKMKRGTSINTHLFRNKLLLIAFNSHAVTILICYFFCMLLIHIWFLNIFFFYIYTQEKQVKST